MTIPALTPSPAAPRRSDDSATFAAAADAFVAWQEDFPDEMNLVIAAIIAEASALNYNTTSSTSVAIGTGAKSFTAGAGRLIVTGQFLLIASTASPSNWMWGQVTSYNSSTGALVMNITTVGGSGTLAAWTISVTPPAGTGFVTLTGAETLTNKNITTRVVTDVGTSGTLTPTADTADQYNIVGLTGGITLAAPSGTPTAGQKLFLRIKDNGTSRSISWNAIYRSFGGVALPTATVLGKTMYFGLVYNSTDSKWDVVGTATET